MAWLENSKTGAVVLVLHADTIARCLTEGWRPRADPNEAIATSVAPATAAGAAEVRADATDVPAEPTKPTRRAKVRR